MKKIILSALIFLSACVPSYETAPKMKDYTQVPLLELPVERVNIVSKVGYLERLPHVENLMPLTPEKRFFVYDNYKYVLSYGVSVRILDEEQNELRKSSIEGYVSRKLPQKASVLQRDNMFAQMLYEMEEQLDKQMAEEIQQNLTDM